MLSPYSPFGRWLVRNHRFIIALLSTANAGLALGSALRLGTPLNLETLLTGSVALLGVALLWLLSEEDRT